MDEITHRCIWVLSRHNVLCQAINNIARTLTLLWSRKYPYGDTRVLRHLIGLELVLKVHTCTIQDMQTKLIQQAMLIESFFNKLQWH